MRFVFTGLMCWCISKDASSVYAATQCVVYLSRDDIRLTFYYCCHDEKSPDANHRTAVDVDRSWEIMNRIINFSR